MSIIIFNTKHKKWDPEWQENVKSLSSNLDQTKQTQVETILTEGKTKQDEKTKIEKELRKLKDEQRQLTNVFAYAREAGVELTRLTTNHATHDAQAANFLGATFEGTNSTGAKYRTDGWLKLTENHLTPTSGTLDNIYKVKVGAGEEDTTEEQVINTIARVVKALEKIDAADFEAKYNAKESDTTKQTQVKTLLKYLQDQAKEVIVGSAKDGKQKSYDFSANYHKFDKSTNTWTAYTQPAFNYQHFFDFIGLVHSQAFLADLDAAKQANVDKNENWQIFLKGDKWEKDQLKEYGVVIDDSKTTLYKTSETEKKTLSAGKGISGWLDLAHAITEQANNLTKLNQAFSSSPTQQLLTDLSTWTKGTDGYLSNGTYTLPESVASMQTCVDELEAKKISSATEQALIAKQIKEKNDELTAKNSEISTKETALNTLIKEIITKQREELKTYNLIQGFKDANKRTQVDLGNIQALLLSIRYLEKDGDATLDSSVSSENTALTLVHDILEQVNPEGINSAKCGLVNTFRELAYKTGGSREFDIQQALSRIKAGKYTQDGKEKSVYFKLATFAEHFENKDKLVKLTEWEQQAWTAIKQALGKQENPTDTLKTYQDKLKALDPLLTESVITQAVVDDFKQYNNFKSAISLETFFKKVLKDGKLQESFKSVMTKADAEITDLAKLVQKKKAKEIIILVARWEYDESSTELQTKTLKMIKMNMDKKKGDELTKDEIEEGLFKLATSQFSKKSDEEIKEWEEGKKDDEKTGFSWKSYGYIGVWVPLLIVALIAVVAFWDKIKSLWNSPSDEKEQEDDE